MKIIDILNKIANDEELPEKIYCFNREFCLKENVYFGDTFTLMHYIQEEDLNDEVEIIEEEKKIPEKLDYCEENTFVEQKETTYLSPKERRLLDSNFKELSNKINSIIDYLKSKGDE